MRRVAEVKIILTFLVETDMALSYRFLLIFACLSPCTQGEFKLAYFVLQSSILRGSYKHAARHTL